MCIIEVYICEYSKWDRIGELMVDKINLWIK
jgi:hypothetical protein